MHDVRSGRQIAFGGSATRLIRPFASSYRRSVRLSVTPRSPSRLTPSPSGLNTPPILCVADDSPAPLPVRSSFNISRRCWVASSTSICAFEAMGRKAWGPCLPMRSSTAAPSCRSRCCVPGAVSRGRIRSSGNRSPLFSSEGAELSEQTCCKIILRSFSLRYHACGLFYTSPQREESPSSHLGGTINRPESIFL